MPKVFSGTSCIGVLAADVMVALDETDPPITTRHDLARLLLACDNAPLFGARVALPTK